MFYNHLVPTKVVNPGRHTQWKQQVLQCLFRRSLSTTTACSSRVPITSSHKTKSHLKLRSIIDSSWGNNSIMTYLFGFWVCPSSESCIKHQTVSLSGQWIVRALHYGRQHTAMWFCLIPLPLPPLLQAWSPTYKSTLESENLQLQCWFPSAIRRSFVNIEINPTVRAAHISPDEPLCCFKANSQ